MHKIQNVAALYIIMFSHSYCIQKDNITITITFLASTSIYSQLVHAYNNMPTYSIQYKEKFHYARLV